MEAKGASRFQHVKDILQIALLIFGAGFGIYTFIYKDIIVPAQRPPAVTLAATLEELDRADGMILLRMHLVVANRGDAKVWVPALWWNVYGVGFGGEERTVSEFIQAMRPALKTSNGWVSRFSNIRASEIVASGYVPDFELWYQPKDESVHEQLFLVPENRFDAVQLYANAYITKSLDRMASTRWEITDNGDVQPTLLIKQDGWDKDPNRVVSFAPETNRDDRRMLDQHAAGTTFTVASLRLKPKAPPAVSEEQKPKP